MPFPPLSKLVLAATALLALSGASAQEPRTDPVYTRARLMSSHEEPGGKLYLGEFHRPRPWLLRTLSWTYFKVFEPYGLALWDSHDPVLQLQAMPGVHCERHTAFFGNFQVIVATKAAAS